MRYSLEETTYLLSKFNSGDTVTISLYNLSDSSEVTIDSNSCSEIGTSGVFKWSTSNITTAPTTYTEYLWIMTNTSENKYGKLVIGGVYDLIKDQTDKLTFTDSNINSQVVVMSDIDFTTTQKSTLNSLPTLTIDEHNQLMSIPDSTSVQEVVWNAQKDSFTLSGSFGELLNTTHQDIKRTLGLIHENIYIDNPIYDESNNLISARVRIYSDSSSVGTESNIIGTYLISSDADSPGKFNNWSQVKI